MSLTILSASAGAGKTFRLSREFVALALSHSEPSYAAGILAMTFTNKATSEMKSRILSLLDDIRKGNVNKQTEESGEIKTGSVSALSGLYLHHSEEEIQQRALNIIVYLLKKYHHFSIFTIDSFFQKIVRQFQRELSLEQPFDIELDQSRVLEESIEYLLQRLRPNEPAFNWLLSYIGEKLEEGKSWDIREDLKSLGRELFKEGVTESWGDLDLKDMEASYQYMTQYLRDSNEQLNEFRKRWRSVFEDSGISISDYKYNNTGAVGALLNIEDLGDLSDKKRFMIEAAEESGYYSAKSPLKSTIQQYVSQFIAIHAEVMHLMDERLEPHLHFKVLIKKYRSYVALRFLYQALQDYCKENDILLLSESNKLVSRVVEEQYTDILYEKSGQRYQHVMIDEFQDTSEGQWKNLRPLFENSLSTNKASLIVGDIKQAIYRWRNGDWKIMHYKVKDDFNAFGEMIQEESLPNNFRSATEIVNFNNQFFKLFISQLSLSVLPDLLDHPLVHSISDIYKDVEQNPIKDSDQSGYVKITVIPESVSQEQTEEYTAEESDGYEPSLPLKEWLADELNKLFNQGYEAGDIAILVRNGKEASLTMEWLLDWKDKHGDSRYAAISDNGYLLRNSSVIQLLMYALNWRINPGNKALIPALLYFWHQVNESPKQERNTHDIINDQDEWRQLSEAINYTRITTLSEWFVNLIVQWNLQGTGVAYTTAFLDEVRAFEIKEGNDPHSFLSWWTVKEKSLGIAADEEHANAIRVLTIHKSKGLQFPVVILPFTSENPIKFMNDEVIYVPAPNYENIDHLGIMPISPSKVTLRNTSFLAYLHEEEIMKAIDSLNLLYVANTRAEQRLLIAVVASDKGNTVGDLILQSLPSDMKEGESPYLFGNPQALRWKKSQSGSTSPIIPIPVEALKLRLDKPMTGVWVDKELPTISSLDSETSFTNVATLLGTVTHEILARIGVPSDLPKVLSEIIAEGLVDKSYLPALKEKTETFLALEEVKEWFKPEQKVYTEKEIIEVNGKSYKPDRVITLADKTILIDFKTGKKSAAYQAQINKYAQLLEDMDLQGIECYLAYIDLLEIVPVQYSSKK